MRFEELDIGELVPAEWNPRTITDEAYSGLRRSIDRFGLVEPIVWNERSRQVVGGHQRLRVLLDDGASRVPVVVVDLDESDEKALNIALNNPHTAGEFDASLQGILADLQDDDPALFADINLEDLLEIELERDPLNMDPGDGSPTLSNRTFVVTPEQDKVIAQAMERVHAYGVFVPEDNQNDNGNEIASICAYFLEWSKRIPEE